MHPTRSRCWSGEMYASHRAFGAPLSELPDELDGSIIVGAGEEAILAAGLAFIVVVAVSATKPA